MLVLYRFSPKRTRGRSFCSALWLLEFWFDRLVVVGIGAGRALAQDLGFRYLADEEHMAAQVDLLQDLAGEHGVGVPGDVIKAVGAAFLGLKVRELIHFAARLHTEAADGLKGDILGEDAEVENAGFLDGLPGEISHLAGDRDPQRLRGHLEGGVDNAGIITVPFARENIEPIAQIPRRAGVNFGFLAISESNG